VAQDTPDQVLSPSQLAARLGISVHTVNWRRRRGLGPKYTKINSTVGVFLMSDVLAWEREQTACEGK
jgi:predicted DNA-binding transcriptional regulator AlpA